MPNQDGTGPMGAGPLTGGGRGPCGMGLAQGRGLGRFWGRKFQKPDLADYIKSLEEELEEAKKQLSDQK